MLLIMTAFVLQCADDNIERPSACCTSKSGSRIENNKKLPLAWVLADMSGKYAASKKGP